MISKKLFCTTKLAHKDWIYKNIFLENKEWRLYDTSKYSCENIFHNEMGWFFEYMINQNLKIYYITCSPTHNVIYTDECYGFFKSFKIDPENTIMPENLKKLRELQSNDLMYFYENLILESFYIISKIKNNLYYYDMLICVKQDFDVNSFFKINFGTVKIESITPIFYENITYNYMQQIFDFEELSSYHFCNTLDNLFNESIIKANFNSDFKNFQEYKILKNYEYEQTEILNNINYQHNDPLFWYYDNEYNGAVSEISDQKLVFKYYFSQFGWQWFILNYNFYDMYAVEARDYTYPVNEPFLLTTDGLITPMATFKNSEIKEFNQQYETGCVFDLLENLDFPTNYSIQSYDISVPKILYNTSYKCRLNKIKK